ncbi:MAG: hypothetical protein FJY29_11220 [Betaproteobacteria bacterium]|nr:hypothetical protein [Betaproteobacteria bacterium]
MNVKTRLLSASLLVGVSSWAQASILPPNDLHLEDNLGMIANMTEEEFKEIIDGVVKHYQELAAKYKANIKVNALWSNSTVNASAQQMGNTWIINMYGGLARRSEVTADGFAMVVCHELGHHFAGFPLKGTSWAANEGQSDYFATHTCARRIWGEQKDVNAQFRSQVGDFERSKCDEAYVGQDDRDLCYRTAAAGFSLANLLSKLGSSAEPRFDTPDTKKVSRTADSHPAAQCRLDTYFQGALCGKPYDFMLIPGKKNPRGQNSIQSEEESAKYSCTELDAKSFGLRPTCWFRSRLTLKN